MKTKKSIWYITFSFVMLLALILGINLNTQAKAVQAESDEHITFDVRVDEEVSKTVSTNYNGTFDITYTVTETTGVDALQLRLGYDKTAFTLESVVSNNATTLGLATKGQEEYLENVVYENADAEGIAFVVDAQDNNVLLITATFSLKNPTPATAYTFSLYNVNDEGELNIGYSKAWRIEKAEGQSATHAPVEIRFINEATVYVQGQFLDFTLEGGEKIYDAVAVSNDAITISYNEDSTVPVEMRPAILNENLVWFEYDQEIWEQQNVSRYKMLNSNPVNVGTYYVVAKHDGNNFFSAYQGYTEDEFYGGYGLDIMATYVINPRPVTINIDNKESAYGEALLPLTYSLDEESTLAGEEELNVLNIALSTNADNTVPGTYGITGSYENPNYNVSFTNGTYTITARNVVIIIEDKTSKYGENIVELTYTIDSQTPLAIGDELADLNIELSTTATSSSNVGMYPITGNYNNTKYAISFRNAANTSTEGTYTITSVGNTVDDIKAFFSGATVEFDANTHNLLIVSEDKPNWIGYNAENNNQTNANTYQITVNVLVTAQDARNFIDATISEDQNYIITVNGTITPKAVVVNADNKGHVYGNEPETLTPVTVGINNEVTVEFAVINANEEEIQLSKTTPVGTYAIVPNATNTNYTFTFNNGTYTVTKTNAVITITAEDVFYNREYNYSSTAKANLVDVAKTIVVKDANGNVVDTNTVLDAGVYTVEVTVEGTDNYEGAVETKTFEIKKISLATPEVSYNGSTATWTAVTTDEGEVELYNSQVNYVIDNENYNNREFTPSATGNYTLRIVPTNTNYEAVEVELATVYSVVFTEGNHPASTATVENMPATQYVFNGQKAVQPEEIPTLTGYTFREWDFVFTLEITSNKTIPALWTITKRTMTVVFMADGENGAIIETSKTFTVNYNTAVNIETSNLLEKANIEIMRIAYDLDGMHYQHNMKWNYGLTGVEEYLGTEVSDISINATENYTFVAVYTATPITYVVTYMLKIENGEYAQYGETQEVAYNTAINYVQLANVNWFKGEAWFANEERTQAAPENMPASNLTVYGAYVFNIGLGDVNGDGKVNANDITLYRQWIVGGYEMTEVENGTEWAIANGEEFDAEGTYFLTRVADDNAATLEATVLGDEYLDIRDVSTIRMAMVGGYGFSVIEGKNVNGEEIVVVRTIVVESASDLLLVAKNGQKVELNTDINEPNFDAVIENAQNDIIIDLKGHTLNLKSFRVTLAQGNTGKILITNGRINVADGNGVYLTAVDGSVHLDNVTLYDDNGEFVIQTANHSLHLFNIVKFLKKEIVNNEAIEVAAEVKIEKDTHIVVEETAQLTIDKVVVTDNFEPAEESSISIDVKSQNIEELVVEGYAEIENDDNNVIKPTYIEVATNAEFIAAAAQSEIKGIKLLSDLADLGKVNFADYITIDGNGKTISGNSALNLNVNGAKITNVKFQNIHNSISQLTPVYATNLSGKLEIENCEFNTIDWDAIQTTPVAGAEIIIKNNTFKHSGLNAVNTRRYVHIQSGYNVDFAATIENNKFYNVSNLKETAIEVYYPTNENKVVIQNNYVDSPVGVCILLRNNNENAWELANNFVEEDLETPVTMSAAIITSYNVYFFRTLQEAVDFAGTNPTTITLLADSNGNGVIVKANQNITFDFNNHTYTLDGTTVGSTGTETNGFQLLKDSVVTFKNGTLKTTTAKILLQNYANTTLNNFVVSGENAPHLTYVASNNFGSLTVENGSKILAYGDQVAFDLWYGMSSVYDAGITVTLKNGTEVVGPVEYGAARRITYDFTDKAVLNVEDGAVWGKVITLTSNIDYSTTYTERNARDYGREHKVDLKDYTLDLNGHTISTINATVVFGGNGAIIKNGTFDLVKKNTDGSFKDGSYALIVDNSVFTYGKTGTVVVEDVTCIGGVNVCCATVTLNNVSAQTTPTKFYTVWAEQNANVTINSGNYTDAQTNGKGVLATGTKTEGGATITVNGGTFTANNKVVYNSETNAIQIKGGSFTKDPTAYVADKHYVEEENGIYTVKEYTTVSTVAEIAAVRAQGGFYQLGADIVYNGQLAFTANTTINLNGHKLQSLNNSALSINDGKTLTIEGNGNVEAQEVCVLVLDGSNAVINGGIYTSHDNFVVGTNGSTGRGNNTITINAGTFNGYIQSAGYVACGIYVANSDIVVVNGGTFNIENGAGILARSGNTTVASDVIFNVTGNGTLGKVGDSKVVVPTGEELVIDYLANYPGGTPVLTNNTQYDVYTIEA